MEKRKKGLKNTLAVIVVIITVIGLVAAYVPLLFV